MSRDRTLACGPMARTTLESACALAGRRAAPSAGNEALASSSTTKPHRPALRSASRLKAAGHIRRPIDDHVLQEIAHEGVDGALERSIDLQVIGDGAVRPDVFAAVAQDEARGVAEGGAAGVELLERSQARFLAGQLAAAQGDRLTDAFAVRPLARQCRFGGGAAADGDLERRAHLVEVAPGRVVLRADTFRFGAELARLEIQPLPLGGHPIAHLCRVVPGLAQRAEGRRRREDRGARGIGFLFDDLHGRLRGRVVGLARAHA